MCGRDGRTICGPLRVPKSTYVTLAHKRKQKFFYFGCSLVRWFYCKVNKNNNGTDGQTARRTDRVRRNMRPLPREEGRIIIWYRSVYNQTASDAWRYNNPVYKLTTGKLQLMLIDVRLDQFFNIKVSQGSVATRLRRDGNFNNQFITQSLLSQSEEKKLKIGQNLPKLWAIKYRVVF